MGNFDWNVFIDNLWERENAQGKRGIEGKGGYRNGKYYPYITSNGNTDIGPGFDLKFQSPEFRERAKKGFTRQELDSIVQKRLKKELSNFNSRITKEGGDTAQIPDNVYAGLLDMHWQLGNGLYGFNKFWKAVANQDYEGMRKESVVTYKDSKGNKHVDTGRRNFRNSTYFTKPQPQETHTILPAVIVQQPDALRVSNPYLLQQQNTITAPVMVPEENSYIQAHRLTEEEQKRNQFQKAVDNKIKFNRLMDAISVQNNPTPSYKPQNAPYVVSTYPEGGQMERRKLWDELTLPEQAEMMKVAVSEGIFDLKEIRQRYNEFAEGGGISDEEYYSTMEKVAEDNYQEWGLGSPDEALVHALNDNTYNYRGYYGKYPQSTANADTHWTDEFKTVWHPTFSNESIYSGQRSQYNPLGLTGGYWVGDTFIPRAWQMLDSNKHSIGGPLVEAAMNEYKNGGGIHIKPSHRGRLTELKKRTGKSEAELYRTGSPATRKMITFARNARKWKHGLGGNLFDGTSQDSQRMQIGLNVQGWPNYTTEQIIANGERIQQQRKAIQDAYLNFVTESNDATAVANGKPQNQHLVDKAIEGAKAHRAWEKEHPVATQWGNVLGAVPFAVAAYPLAATAGSGIAALGDAAAATSIGQGITNFLAPIATTSYAGATVPQWFDLGLTSGFGAHGIQTAIDEGGVSPMTAFEVAPLGRLAKPMWNAGKEGVQYTTKVADNTARHVSPAYDLYRTVSETTPRTTPTLHSFHSRDLTGSGFVENVYTGSPLFEFGQTMRTSPENAYFMRAPKDVDVLKLGNGKFRHETVGNEVLPSGEVNGKFVSYGEPWQEFALGENSALYEFPVGPRRGPGLMATDWKGRPQKYSVDEVYDYMQQEEALKKELASIEETMGDNFLKQYSTIRRNLINEKYPALKEHIDTSIHGANQTVIPNERWNFNKFLKTPFWKYSEDPLSGQVQKELMTRWPKANLSETPAVEWSVGRTATEITDESGINSEILQNAFENQPRSIGDIIRGMKEPESMLTPEQNARISKYANNPKDPSIQMDERLSAGGADRLKADDRVVYHDYPAVITEYVPTDRRTFLPQIQEAIERAQNTYGRRLTDDEIRGIADEISAGKSFAVKDTPYGFVRETLPRIRRGIEKGHEKSHIKVSPKTYSSPLPKDFLEAKWGKDNYMVKNNGDEQLPRLSQIKAYYGKDEISTEELMYAAENYVKDTKVDNNMTDFFNAIKEYAKQHPKIWEEMAKYGSEAAPIGLSLLYLNKD